MSSCDDDPDPNADGIRAAGSGIDKDTGHVPRGIERVTLQRFAPGIVATRTMRCVMRCSTVTWKTVVVGVLVGADDEHIE